jgi:CMP-N,N'-diacetyllegionaminic acid synthase
MKKVLAIIPARGGSKGVPNKNIKELGGVPLICWSIRAARESGVVDKIVVSTDSDNIKQVAEKEAGVEVIKRPEELAQDNSLVIEAIRHVVSELEKRNELFEFILLLEPTSPLRTKEDIIETVNILKRNDADSVASFTETKVPPARIWRIEGNSVLPFIAGSNAFLPRQQHEKGFYINGVIYGFRTTDLKNNPGVTSIFFGKTAPIVIPESRVIDIDSPIDFALAEILIRQNNDQ